MCRLHPIAPYCLAVLLHKHTLSHTFQVWRCIGLQGMPLKGSGMQWKVSNDQIREAAHVEIDCPYNGSTLVAIKGVSTQYKYFLPWFQQDTTWMKMGRNTQNFCLAFFFALVCKVDNDKSGFLWALNQCMYVYCVLWVRLGVDWVYACGFDINDWSVMRYSWLPIMALHSAPTGSNALTEFH